MSPSAVSAASALEDEVAGVVDVVFDVVAMDTFLNGAAASTSATIKTNKAGKSKKKMIEKHLTVV